MTITPPLDETNYSADNHAALIVDTLEVFDHSSNDLLYLVADKTNLNPAIANILKIPMIGCASHKFNLAVQDFLTTFRHQIDSINNLMSNLKNVKVAGRLRQHTTLEPITLNRTRWSSTYCMLKRYFEIRPFIDDLEEIITATIPRHSEDRALKEIMESHLTYFEQVTKYLQKEDTTLIDVRDIFEACTLK